MLVTHHFQKKLFLALRSWCKMTANLFVPSVYTYQGKVIGHSSNDHDQIESTPIILENHSITAAFHGLEFNAELPVKQIEDVELTVKSTLHEHDQYSYVQEPEPFVGDIQVIEQSPNLDSIWMYRFPSKEFEYLNVKDLRHNQKS